MFTESLPARRDCLALDSTYQQQISFTTKMTEASLDQILIDFVGGFGKYQLLNTVLMSWVYQTGLITIFLTVFTANAPNHRCFVPECESFNQTKVNMFELMSSSFRILQ